MRLHALRLQNFRQHANTHITFESGLTGIIGPNGAGKSTILEAIAWALYGNAAARGTRDSIRFARAEPRSSVLVELDFELAGHRYRVVRELTKAECFLDGGDVPIANTLTGVSELLQRRIGMTRSEFFHTYFTGQKELDVMAALGPTDRARFLSRVLGYDRLTSAQERAREKKRALQSEVNGLKQGMPDADVVAKQLADARERLTLVRTRQHVADQERATTAAQLAEIAPRWAAAQTEREQIQSLLSEIRVVDGEAQALTRDAERLERDLAAIATAQEELAPLTAALLPLSGLRDELRRLDELAGAELRREALQERLRGLADDEARLAGRLVRLETAPMLERDTTAQLNTQRSAVTELERELEEARTAWVRDRQEADTRLEALRVQYAELTAQRATLEGLGEESPCPTCGRPLGPSYRTVLELLSEQIETVRVDGNYYRQRAEQLSRTPDTIDALDERRKTSVQELNATERRLVKIQGALQEMVTLGDQRGAITARLVETRTEFEALPSGYDRDRHAGLRAESALLGEIETRVARLSGLVDRGAAARSEQERVLAARHRTRLRVDALSGQRAGFRLDDDAFVAIRQAHDRAVAESRRAELDAVAAEGERARAQSECDTAERAQRELERLRAGVEALEVEKRLNDELDRTLADLRTDLNHAVRPELAAKASEFLDVLTDGRYADLDFDDDYTPIVYQGDIPKPVLSGGEEDLCNLVLRLAISQMIAERAGQDFSLLILDEIFGSLDDTRRDNVVELLRRLNLHKRFEQVIVITHIEQVREGLDRVLIVRYDEESGAARVETAQRGERLAFEPEISDDDILSGVST